MTTLHHDPLCITVKEHLEFFVVILELKIPLYPFSNHFYGGTLLMVVLAVLYMESQSKIRYETECNFLLSLLTVHVISFLS